MKKLLVLVLLVFGFSLGLAQGSRSALGLYVLGAQHTLDTGAVELRLGAGLPLLFFGSGGGNLLSGSVDLLFSMVLVGSSAR